MHACMCVCVLACMHACVCVCACMHACVCVCACMHVCVFVCMTEGKAGGSELDETSDDLDLLQRLYACSVNLFTA